MSGVVRRPAGRDTPRSPYPAIDRRPLPDAVVGEVFVTDHLARHVNERDGAILANIAVAAPAVEPIRRRHIGGLTRLRRAIAVDRYRFMWMHDEGGSLGRPLHLAAAQGHFGALAIGRHRDAIAPRAQGGEREVRRIDLEGVVTVEAVDAHVERALTETDLGDVIVEGEEGERGQ